MFNDSVKNDRKDKIVTFEFEGKKVRTAIINANTWWCLMDLYSALELTNVSNANKIITDEFGLTSDVICTVSDVDSHGRKAEINFIHESAMYHLVFTSRKPEAQRFRQWVYRDVLPSIRKTGGYGRVDDLDTLYTIIGNEIAHRNLLKAHQAKIEEHDQRIESLEKQSFGVSKEEISKVVQEESLSKEDVLKFVKEEAIKTEFPKDCMDLDNIRQFIFWGISQTNISKFLTAKLHPIKEYYYQVKNGAHGGEFSLSKSYKIEGLQEKFRLLLSESIKAGESTPINHIMYHPILGRYMVKRKELIMELDKGLDSIPMAEIKTPDL
jgi:prophage antirepressor-like protein